MQKNIAAEGLQAAVINMAVSDNDGELKMKKILGHKNSGLVDSPIKEGDVSWYRGTSYVDFANVEGIRYGVPDNEYLSFESITVKCVTLNTLVEMLDLDSIDYMQIDVEGHELHILENYNFKIRPTMIKIEHKHTEANGKTPEDILNILKKHKYHTFKEKEDIYGIY